MSNATTAPLNDGATINTQLNPTTSTISITSSELDEFLSAIFAVMGINTSNIRNYFESQPVALASLGMHIQVSKDDGERMALNSFINSIRFINTALLNILKRQNAYNDLERIVLSLPTIDDPTE